MFYVIDYENGATLTGEFKSYCDCLALAESFAPCGCEFTISEYDSEEDYDSNY